MAARYDLIVIGSGPGGASLEMARHSMDFWLQAEDLPRPENRVYIKDNQVHLDLIDTNTEALTHLKRKLKNVLSQIGWPAVLLERSLYLGKNIPLSGTAHQAGACRFGTDPATSVLNLDCRAHDHGTTQVALDGLDGVEVEVVSLQPDKGSAHVELLGYRQPRGRSFGPLAANDIVWYADRTALLRGPDGHLHQLVTN